MLQASYFESLPEPVYNELVYNMNIFRIERGNYLFRPGDPNSTIYIVAEGLLEISITVNEKHLHLLKKSSGVKDIEHSPKIPKRKT